MRKKGVDNGKKLILGVEGVEGVEGLGWCFGFECRYSGVVIVVK